MGKTRKRHPAVESDAAHAHETHDLRDLATATDLLWLAEHQRDVAAMEARASSALDGMPVHRSHEPRLPLPADGADLSGDVARELDTLVREVMDARPTWRPDERETVRWRQAALEWPRMPWGEHERLDWSDIASRLRRRAERVIGDLARGRWLGPCPVPDCSGEVRMGVDQQAAVCEECGVFVTREQQAAYVAQELDDRLMSLSKLATALVTANAPVPYRTLQSWVRRGMLAERHDDGSLWRGVPWALPSTGLYRFRDALDRAAKRATRVRVEHPQAA